jgi:hypothetical protein
MFERFTERARQVVVLAQEEARTLKHNYIGTEHILLGLLREEEGVAARVLESLNIAVERVRGEVIRIVGSGEEVTSGQIPFTPRAKKVLELSLREALSLGHNDIGTEHILLGLVRENEGVAARILLDFDADSEKIRNEVIRMLSGQVARSVPLVARVSGPAPRIQWHRASFLWRPEGLELRIPLAFEPAELVAFANDAIWSSEPFTRLRREIWQGWLALASPTLLDDVSPGELRRLLDGACERARGADRSEGGRLRGFLDGLRIEPEAPRPGTGADL